MPGPEQRKMEQEASRQKALSYLRQVRLEREEQKSRSLKSANDSKDNTASAAGFRVPSPIVSNTNSTTKAINEDKVPIYKYNPNPASLKRKAVEISDGFESEQGDKHRHGREAKKAKPTSGYVPGTGKPYRGTARERPSPPPPGLVGALSAKSTNAPLKRRETVAKQDTKNLNRNALKPAVVYGKGTGRLTQSRPTQDPLDVAGPKAVDEGATKRLQRTKRDAPTGVELGTMADVEHKPPQALKRKRGQDLENETKKKSKIGPSTAPPVGEPKVVKTVPQARTSSFFARIQKPGHTAAIPTNVRHVQEVVKKAKPELPKTPQTNVESPLVKEADTGASSKKRQREDDAGSERSKRAKLSIPGRSGQKSPSIIGKPEESPKGDPQGLKNHRNACFANASLQSLFGVPDLLERYEACGEVSSEEVQSMFKGYTDLLKDGKAPDNVEELREQLRALVEDKRFISASFSQLVGDLREAKQNSISPYVFMQACGALFEDEDGSPLDGETEQDAAHFLNALLKRLRDEEIMEGTEAADPGKPSLIDELFQVERGETLVCKECANTRDGPSPDPADCYGLTVVLPTSEKSTTLGELLTNTRSGQLLTDYICQECKTKDATTMNPFVKRLPRYLIVQAPRARHMEGTIQKIHTSVEIPTEALDLSFLLKRDKGSEPYQYEVFCIVEHKGNTEKTGHYVACKKIQGIWYLINDAKIHRVPETELPTHGHLFFLRRV